MEIVKRTVKIDPNELTYHKDRFLKYGKCEHVTYIGAFRGDNVLTNEIDVVTRGVEPGKIARFLVRYGEQETHLDMDLVTCRYEAEKNIKTKHDDIVLVFEIAYYPETVQ